MPCRAEFFQDRRDAGRLLARVLREAGQESDIAREWQDGIVLGLPRGGVPVAYKVARALNLPLDILVVRKLGVAGLEELAKGAVASDGTVTINASHYQPNLTFLWKRLMQQRSGRRGRSSAVSVLTATGVPPPRLEGRMVILVDDGLATGASAARCSASACVRGREKSSLRCPWQRRAPTTNFMARWMRWSAQHIATSFHSVGRYPRNFEQTTEEEVCTLLSQGRRRSKKKDRSLVNIRTLRFHYFRLSRVKYNEGY